VHNLNLNGSLVSAVPAIAAALLILLSGCGRSPSDQELVLRFKENRAVYERLRDLLLGDTNLKGVAPFGVQMADSPIYVTPPTPLISSTKYQDYLDLLKSVGGTRAGRSEGPHSVICIGVYVAGWYGNTSHKNICWRETPLAKGGRFADKLIERNWYLEQD
jgi:hypothetical protein